jgi:hypothetical protein
LYNWLDRTNLFKISKLVYGARVIVTIFCGKLRGQSLSASVNVASLCASLQAQRQFMRGIEIAIWPFVSVKVYGLGEFFVKTDVVGRDKFGHFKSC